MPAALASGPTQERPLDCGNCQAPMQRLGLAGHYGASVELDVCASCDLVWFDGTETARLNGPGLLELIGLMAAAYDLPHQPLRAAHPLPALRRAG